MDPESVGHSDHHSKSFTHNKTAFKEYVRYTVRGINVTRTQLNLHVILNVTRVDP